MRFYSNTLTAPRDIVLVRKKKYDFQDMRGVIDSLTVLQRAPSRGRRDAYWECLCVCGIVQEKNGTWLRKELFHSCSVCARKRSSARGLVAVPKYVRDSNIYELVERVGRAVIVRCKVCGDVSKKIGPKNVRYGCKKCSGAVRSKASQATEKRMHRYCMEAKALVEKEWDFISVVDDSKRIEIRHKACGRVCAWGAIYVKNMAELAGGIKCPCQRKWSKK